jgi:hypothetical protein
MDASAAVRIERLNYLLGAALAAGAALILGPHVGLGVLVGAAISAANFSVLRRLVGRMLGPRGEEGAAGGDADRRQTRGAVLFLPKMAALVVAVALAIYYLPVSPIAVAVGFSIFLVSFGVETVRFLTRESHG